MMRKTSIDIPAIIAEGCGKQHPQEFAHALTAAVGYSNRLEYYGIMARDLKFVSEAMFEEFSRRLAEVRMMTSGLSKKVAVA